MSQIQWANEKKVLAGRLGALWGTGGVIALLSYSVWRLAQVSIDALEHPWSWYHWTLLVANALFMAYSEGYRGFQKAFSPRVAARARYISLHPTISRVLLAPLFCMGYFYATRRRLITSYLLTITIVTFIISFQYLAQPWRGVLDTGVLIGLIWGIVSLFFSSLTAALSEKFDVSPEVPAR